MEEFGVIEKKEKNKMFIRLEGPPKGACEHCGIKNICSTKEEERIITIADESQFNVGEQVKIEISESRTILLSFLVFIVPLLLFISGYLLIKSISNGIYGISGGALILVAYFLLISMLEKSLFKAAKIKKTNT